VNRVDREALKRALSLLRSDPEYRDEALKRALSLLRSDPEYRDQIAAKLAGQSWEDVAHFCAYCCQIVGLKPWQDPPMYAETRPDPDALAILVKLLGAGLSRFEPDPAAALAEVRGKPPLPA
jgi:hypothetical protein